jgi:CHAD domain-containing protein
MIWHVPAGTDAQIQARHLCAHLSCRFEAQWRSYCEEFEHCRKEISEGNTHNLRVAARRLRATLNILRDVVPGQAVEQSERSLKKVFKALAPLRENHVQLEYLENLRWKGSEVRVFRKNLRERARELEKRAKRKMKLRRLADLIESLTAIEKWFGRLQKNESAQNTCLEHILSALGRKYSDAMVLRRQIDPSETKTIHRARVAFKEFRYGLESLHPAIVRIPKGQLAAMDRYQTMMGRIQDFEVLVLAARQAGDPEYAEGKTTTSLVAKLEKEKIASIRKYLRSADQISRFWPHGLSGPRLDSLGVDAFARRQKLSEIREPISRKHYRQVGPTP